MDEENNTEEQPLIQPQELETPPEMSLRGETRNEDVWGSVRVVSAVPTWTPSRLEESLAIYVSGTDIRWYSYDFENNAWRFSTNTTVTAGDGISVSKSGWDYTVNQAYNFKFNSLFGSQSISTGSNYTVNSVTGAFEPQLIIIMGAMDKAAMGTPADGTLVSHPQTAAWAMNMMFWLNGGTYEGTDFGDPNSSTPARTTAGAILVNNGLGRSAKLVIDNVDSDGWDFIIETSGTAGNHTWGWAFRYIAIG